MVIYEEQENDIIKSYSSIGMMILGGYPEGLYAEAFDPKSEHRVYVETDIPIPSDEEEPEEEKQEQEGNE